MRGSSRFGWFAKVAAAGGDAVQAVGYATNLATLTGDSANGNETFTPPSAASGDLLLWIGVGRGATGSPPAGSTGGQTWTQLFNHSANPRQLHVSHAVFNGTWSGDLAGANSVTPGTNFCIVLRATVGTTWNVENLSGPSGIGATTTHSTASVTPSGAPAMVFSVVQKATDTDYSALSPGSFVSLFGGSSDYWNNVGGSGTAGWIFRQFQSTAAATGTVSSTSGSSFAYTRSSFAVYRS